MERKKLFSGGKRVQREKKAKAAAMTSTFRRRRIPLVEVVVFAFILVFSLSSAAAFTLNKQLPVQPLPHLQRGARSSRRSLYPAPSSVVRIPGGPSRQRSLAALLGAATNDDDRDLVPVKVSAAPASTEDDDDEDEDSAEAFGVNEKTLELRYLVRDDDESIDAAAHDAVEDETRPQSSKNVSSTVLKGQKDEKEPLLVPSLSEKAEPTIKDTKEAASSTSKLRPKAVLKFLAPTMALWIAPPIMSLIDTSVVGRYCGPTDLAALSPGCTIIDSSSYLFMFIATATTNLVASARANDKVQDSDRIISEALFLAMCAGSFLMILVLAAGQPLLAAIAGQESSAVIPSAFKYATVRAFGQPAVVMASVARAAALAGKDTTGPLLSVALAFCLNAVGTITLVKYANLGIVGAGIATLMADCVAALFLLARIRKARRRDVKEKTISNPVPPLSSSSSSTTTKPPLTLVKIPTPKSFRKFCQYAAPIFFTIFGKSVVYNGVAVSVGRIGAVALAAHQVLLGSFFFWTPIGDSVGMTSQVFLPGIIAKERERGVPNRGAKRLLFATGVTSGLIAAALAGLLPSKGAGLFTTDMAVATALTQTAPILALSVSMHAIALTCEGMLLAQRDLKFLSSSYVITTIATAALLLGPFRPVTLSGSWILLASFQGGRAIQFALRNMWLSRRNVVKQA